jgi:hypothetical protein
MSTEGPFTFARLGVELTSGQSIDVDARLTFPGKVPAILWDGGHGFTVIGCAGAFEMVGFEVRGRLHIHETPGAPGVDYALEELTASGVDFDQCEWSDTPDGRLVMIAGRLRSIQVKPS